MALGKLGAFLNKDLGALAKDARRVLSTDLSTIAKGAGRVLQTDLGDLLRDTPAAENSAEETIAPVAAKPLPAAAPTVAPAFDPDATQKMERVATAAPSQKQMNPAPTVPAAAFDPDVTQKMEGVSPVPAQSTPSDATIHKNAPTNVAEPTKFNQELLLRTQRAVPTGTEVKVLLPYCVNDFERPHATPSGELTNDPVNAVYSGRGESVTVQLALCWDADEALQLVDEVHKKIGPAGRTSADGTWVIGPTPQGVVFSWTRDCYYFCATSPKGASALARFLSAYEY